MKRKNKAMTAVVVIVIIAVLAVAYAMSPEDSHRPAASAFPDPIQDGDKDYPTAAEVEAQFAENKASLEAALFDSSLDVDAMADELQASMWKHNAYMDKFEWLRLDYNMGYDVEDEYLAWYNLLSVMYSDFRSIIKDALSGPCAGTVEAALRSIGEDLDLYRDHDALFEEAKAALKQREIALVAEYYDILDTEYSVADSNGRTWTLASVAESTTLTDEEKSALTAEIREAMYGDAAAVYVELVGVRNDYAVQVGYGDYLEYSYKVKYGREYTSSEAESIVAFAGKADRMYNSLMGMMGYTYEKLADETAWFAGLDSEGLIDAIAPFIDSVDSDFARFLDYMDEYGLIYNCDQHGRLITAYAASLYTRSSALIYNGYTNPGENASSLIHEFGHAANNCLVDDCSKNYDVKEIHSQGLQALYCASGLVGNGSDRATTYLFLSDLLWNISFSGVLTAFEVWAYETESETGSLTVDQALDRFGEILDSTGCTLNLSYDERYFWADVPHLFSNPNYYASYGTSGINAIELYLEAIEDYDEAREHYLALTYQRGVYGYVPAVEQAGLTNAFDTEASSRILDRLWEALGGLKGRSP